MMTVARAIIQSGGEFPACVPRRPSPQQRHIRPASIAYAAFRSSLGAFASLRRAAFSIGDDAWSKISFKHAQMEELPALFSTADYELINKSDPIIHCAWQVNFNLSVSSFEPQIAAQPAELTSQIISEACSRPTERLRHRGAHRRLAAADLSRKANEEAHPKSKLICRDRKVTHPRRSRLSQRSALIGVVTSNSINVA